MDGAPHLWTLVQSIFIGINIISILDIIHVVEYLWDAGNASFGEGSQELRMWIYEKLVQILKGDVSEVIDELEMRAKDKKLNARKIKQIKRTIRYFKNHKNWMKYDKYLKDGLPIASGVVESTCGHLIKDRMEKSGCRWTIKGAEAILKLRSIKTSNDWDEYWNYNTEQAKNKLYPFEIAA